MAIFTYKAESRSVERAGTAVRKVGRAAMTTGTISADTPRAARDQLRAQGLRVHELQAVSSAGAKRPPQLTLRRAGGRHEAQVIDLCRELSTLLSAGIPLLQALDAMVRQHRGRFGQGVLMLRDRVAAGLGLAEAMRLRPDVFDELTISMVDVGERSGTLDEVLAQVSEFKHRAHQLKGRIGTALIYPAIVVTAGVAVTLFLMTFVVPRLLDALIQAGKPLPMITSIVRACSDLLIHHGYIPAAAVVVLVVAAALLRRSPRAQRRLHALELQLPMLGELLRKQAIVRIAVTLATLTRSGLDFVAALRIVQNTTPNLVMREALHRCELAVGAGRDVAPALESTGAFPPTVVQIVEVGQASGKLDQMLERLARDYDAQVQTAAQRLVAVLEPAMILLLAVFIGTIVLAVIIPYMEAGNVA